LSNDCLTRRGLKPDRLDLSADKGTQPKRRAPHTSRVSVHCVANGQILTHHFVSSDYRRHAVRRTNPSGSGNSAAPLQVIDHPFQFWASSVGGKSTNQGMESSDSVGERIKRHITRQDEGNCVGGHG